MRNKVPNLKFPLDSSLNLWRLSRDHFAENTVKWYHKATCTGFKDFALAYACSEKHYKAMVSEEYFYFGCSNPYWSDNPSNVSKENTNTGYACQFDLFTEVMPRPPYELD